MTLIDNNYLDFFTSNDYNLRPGQHALSVTQSSHSFDILTPVYNNGVSWSKSRSDSESTLPHGIVIVDLSADVFIVAQSGYYNITHGLITGTVYYLSDSVAGQLVTTPTSLFPTPVLVTFGSDEILIYPCVVTSSTSSSEDSGESISKTFIQAAHGLSVLDAVYLDAGIWKKARADDAETLALGVVVSVADVNTFVLGQIGFFTIASHGLTVGEYYALSAATAGLLTDTYPTSGFVQALVYAKDANTVTVLDHPSYQIAVAPAIEGPPPAIVRPYPPKFILSLEDGVNYQRIANITTTNIYWVPKEGNSLTLYDGTDWEEFTSAQITLDLSGLTENTNFDVFAYDNGGTVSLETVAWTNDTTRATSLVALDGLYVKSGDSTRLYIGSFRTTSTGTTERQVLITSSGADNTKLLLFNAYSHSQSDLVAKLNFDISNWYNTTVGTWRVANDSSGWRSQFLLGLPTLIKGFYRATANTDAISTTTVLSLGMDTVAPHSYSAPGSTNTTDPVTITALLETQMGVGFHELLPIEFQNGAGSGLYYGHASLAAGVIQAQLSLQVRS